MIVGSAPAVVRLLRLARAVARIGGSIVAVALLSALLAACGGAPGTADLDEAVEVTLAAGPLEVSATGTATVSGGRPLGTIAWEGIADLGEDASEATVEVSLAGAPSYVADVVRVDGLVFVSGLPGLQTADPAVGDAVLVEGAPRAISADIGVFLDPRAVVELVGGLVGSVTDLGSETVGGTEARRLRIELPESRMLRSIEEILDSVDPELRAGVDAAGELRARAIAEVWIDDEGLIRQLQLTTAAGVGAGQAVPGIGAVDSSVVLRLAPAPDAEAIALPEGLGGRVDFSTLIAAPGSTEPGIGPVAPTS